jgi:hypothetical protein
MTEDRIKELRAKYCMPGVQCAVTECLDAIVSLQATVREQEAEIEKLDDCMDGDRNLIHSMQISEDALWAIGKGAFCRADPGSRVRFPPFRVTTSPRDF